MQENNFSNSEPIISLNNSIGRMTWKNILNIWIVTVVSLVMVISFSPMMVGGLFGKLVALFFTMILTFAVLYGYMWSQGDRDANLVQFERDKYDRFKGLKVGLLMLIPNVLWDLLLLLSMLHILPIDFMPFFRLVNAPLWPLINIIHPHGAWEYGAMEATQFSEALPATDALTFGGFALICLLPLIYTLFCTVGYTLGYKRISIRAKLVYEDPDKHKDDEE